MRILGFFWPRLPLFCVDRSDATEAPEGIEISETNRVVGIAEYGREHEGTHAGKRGEDGGVGVGFVGCSLLLEPFFEKLVGVAAVLSNEEQLVKEQFDVSGSSVGGSWSDAERSFFEGIEALTRAVLVGCGAFLTRARMV